MATDNLRVSASASALIDGGDPAMQQTSLDRLLAAGSLDFMADVPLADDAIDCFLALALNLATVLDELHQEGVVHGNVDPANLLIEIDQDVADQADPTEPGAVRQRLCQGNMRAWIRNPRVVTRQAPEAQEGSLAYSSPEQTGRMSRDVDQRTDLYSLGVIFYRLLTGRLPYSTTDPLALVYAHIATNPAPPVQVRPALPWVLSDIVVKLLAKDPQDRYQSAYGLRTDLELCQAQWQARGVIDPFVLGQDDVSDRLLLPQGLYGRKRERDQLLDAWSEVMAGQPQLLFISGASGIGKSTLAGILFEPVTAQGGTLISSRAESHRQAVPYAPLVDALGDFVHQLLLRDPSEVAAWGTRLQDAMSGNTAQIIKHIPDLALVIDAPSTLASEVSDSKILLGLALQQVLRAIARPDHPLAIFLDDVHWADADTLRLLQGIIANSRQSVGDSACLLVICAYRTDRAAPAPLQLMLSSVPRDRHLALSPLELGEIRRLVADALHTTPDQVGELGRLMQERTGGNPLFLREYLRWLHERSLVAFDHRQRAWKWNLAAIRATASARTAGGTLADDAGRIDVLELVRSRLEVLPETAQRTLKVAAIMGYEFNVDELAVACQQTVADTDRHVGMALNLGAVVPLAQRPYSLAKKNHFAEPRLAAMQQLASQYLFSAGEDLASADRDPYPVALSSGKRGEVDASSQAASMCSYQFAHEQIREASTLLLPSLAEEAIHGQIGRALLQSMTAAQRRERVFTLTRHLNQAPQLLSDWWQRVELAELNLEAGRQALALVAYDNAVSLATKGIKTLQSDAVDRRDPADRLDPAQGAWRDAYPLMRDLHLTAAEGASRTGQFEHCERLLRTIEDQAHSALDCAAVTQVRMLALYLQGKHKEAVVTAVDALRELGVRLPAHPRNRHVLVAMARMRLAMLGRRVETLVDLPPMVDERSIKALEIMAAASISAASVEPKLLMILGLEIVWQTVKHGFHPLSAMGYALHGLLLCGILGQIDPGYAFGQLAMRLVPQIRSKDYRVFVKYFVYAHVSHWKEPVEATLQPLRELTATGEFEYLAVAAGLYPYFTWFIDGLPIEAHERSIADNLHLLEPFKDTSLYYRYVLGQQYYQSLMGRSANPCQMIGEAYDERGLLPVHVRENDRTTIFYLACHKLILCYLFEDFALAQESVLLATAYRDGGTGTPLIPVLDFYHSLACLGRLLSAPASEATRLRRTVAANQRRMRKWARYGPSNCLHRYTLVEAERARARGDHGKARELYDTAINQAQEADYLPELALAHELAARFYLAAGPLASGSRSFEQPSYAETHLRAAHQAYQMWGASAKVSQIEKRNPEIFSGGGAGGGSAFSSLSDYLDMASVLKAAQLLSSETALPRLLETLTRILVENAGADRGYLLLPSGDQWRVRFSGSSALAAAEGQQPSVEPGHASSDQPAVAMSIVRQVAHTKEPLLLNDVPASTAYSRDPHLLAARPRSILCLPLLDRGELVGVFYMENTLTRNAFPPERLQLLTMLATQAAISLKNASLVTGLQEAQDNVQASEQRFRLLFENAPMGIFEIDISGDAPVICAANRRAEAAYGWSSDELATLDPGQLIPDESRHQIQRLIQTVRAGRTAVLETTNRRRDGTHFPVRVIATPARDQKRLHMIVAVEDITAQRQRRSEAEAIDEERRRIAQEIHDGVAQDLAALRLKLSLWRDWVASDPDRMQDELDQTQNTLDAAIEEIRRSIYALRPLALDEVGLLPALQRYIADFNNQFDVYVDLQIDVAEEQVPATLELPLFRVIQEGLNNIVQHADASLAWVRLGTNDGDGINLTIRDNGRGIDLSMLSGAGRSGHLGLKQMRERVEAAGGEMHVDSKPSQGTEIRARLPSA